MFSAKKALLAGASMLFAAGLAYPVHPSSPKARTPMTS